MTVHRFPALGFDPAPGEPDALAGLSRDCGALGVDLAGEATQVRQLADGGVWRGTASDAFRHRLEDLPRDLERAGDAYRLASTALLRFSGHLLAYQAQALTLEERAADLTSRGAEVDVENRLNQVRQEAERLAGDVKQAAADCGRLLREAARHAPHPPSWFHRLVDEGAHLVSAVNQAVGDFVREHAKGLALFAAVLSKVSSALALVAMLAGPVPVLGTAVASLAATGALVAAGGALLAHTALAVYAGGSWTAVVMDAVAVATGVGPRGVEVVAGRIAAGRGIELGETSLSTRAALGVLRHPKAGITQMSESTLTFPQLVTKTVSYQFDLAGGALGIVDLARTGEIGREVEEADERAREAC